MHSSLTCPACSGTIEVPPGVTAPTTCPDCGGRIDTPPASASPAAPDLTEPVAPPQDITEAVPPRPDVTQASPILPDVTAPVDAPLPFSSAFLEDFQLIRVLGQGGMGTAYLMNQVKLDRRVAVKTMKSEDFTQDQASGLIKEARVLAHLNHPAIVAIYDAGMDGELAYMVSEFVEGETLGARLARQPPLTLAQAMKIALNVLDGLKVAHRRGIVHRDLKPDNILLDASGKPKISDFGLARAQHIPSEVSVGKIVGTPEYMSPEQCRGRPATTASDLYSMGVVVFEMATGQRPFRGPSLSEYLMQHARDPAPRARSLRPELPEGLDDLLARMLEKDPAKRVKSAGDFRKALLDINRGMPAGREPAPSKPTAGPRSTSEPAAGNRLSDRYELVRMLGQGGMGQVWLAIDHARDGAEVALKLLPPELWRDPESRANLIKEANFSLKLAHPNIVRLINLEMADAPFLVMEYVAGLTLSEELASRMLEERGPMTPEQALPILENLAGALDHAHGKGVIHRDIKPSNVILEMVDGALRKEGAVASAKLMDFGIAAEMASFRTRGTGVVPMGTLLYMSPEQVSCQRLDTRSDVYSLAATLYQMLTLVPPFQGGDVALAIKNEPVPRPENVAKPVVDTLLRALAKQPQDRPETATRLVDEFRAALKGEVPRSFAGSTQPRSWPPRQETTARPEFARADASKPLPPLPPLPHDSGRTVRWVLIAALGAFAVAGFVFRGGRPDDAIASPSASTVEPASPATSPTPAAVQTAASSTGPSFDEAVRVADDFYRHGAYREALTQYRAAALLRANEPAVMRRTALCLAKLGRLPEALPLIEKAAQKAPTDSAVMNTHANLLLMGRQENKAFSVAERLISMSPGSSDYWDTLGQAQRAVGRDAEARKSFQKALAIDPDNIEAQQNLRSLIE